LISPVVRLFLGSVARIMDCRVKAGNDNMPVVKAFASRGD